MAARQIMLNNYIHVDISEWCVRHAVRLGQDGPEGGSEEYQGAHQDHGGVCPRIGDGGFAEVQEGRRGCVRVYVDRFVQLRP